jgi:hypothetical protein
MTILSSSTPVSQVPLTDNSLINALIVGSKWGGGMGSGVSLTYSFITAGSLFDTTYGNTVYPNSAPFFGAGFFTTQMQTATRAILTDLSRAVGIRFTEVLDSGNSAGEMRFGLTRYIDAGAAAYAYYPNANEAGGDVWVANRSSQITGVTPGSYNYLTLVHEIGHALGLKHSFEAPVRLPTALDNRGVTVMSYTAAPGGIEAATFLPLDLITLQVMYGRNMTTATGNDLYLPTGFGGGIRTIWDAGGTDTFDFSASSASLSISLEPGVVRTGSVPYAIAYDTWIEIAITGRGHDSLEGNAADNRLYANNGNDSLRGFDGNDVLDGGFGNDTLRGDAGDDFILAGFGRDSVAYGRRAADVEWRRNADGAVTVDAGQDGVDVLYGVEFLQFTDRRVTLAQPLRRDLDGDARADLITQRGSDGALTALVFGTGGATAGSVASPASGAVLLATADVSGDGAAELLWRLPGGAGLRFGTMGSASGTTLFDPGSGWTVRATGDLDGDTRADIVWGNASGQTYLWLMDGTSGSSRHQWLDTPGAGWTVQGIADADGDGKGDIFWRHSSGLFWTWLMDGTGIIGNGGQPSPGAGWQVKGFGDLDGDGRADVIWQHSDGMVWAWLMDGPIAARNAPIGNPGAAWSIVAVSDVTGDGLADIVFRNSNGMSWYWAMQGTTIAANGYVANQGTDWNFMAG